MPPEKEEQSVTVKGMGIEATGKVSKKYFPLLLFIVPLAGIVAAAAPMLPFFGSDSPDEGVKVEVKQVVNEGDEKTQEAPAKNASIKLELPSGSTFSDDSRFVYRNPPIVTVLVEDSGGVAADTVRLYAAKRQYRPNMKMATGFAPPYAPQGRERRQVPLKFPFGPIAENLHPDSPEGVYSCYARFLDSDGLPHCSQTVTLSFPKRILFKRTADLKFGPATYGRSFTFMAGGWIRITSCEKKFAYVRCLDPVDMHDYCVSGSFKFVSLESDSRPGFNLCLLTAGSRVRDVFSCFYLDGPDTASIKLYGEEREDPDVLSPEGLPPIQAGKEYFYRLSVKHGGWRGGATIRLFASVGREPAPRSRRHLVHERFVEASDLGTRDSLIEVRIWQNCEVEVSPITIVEDLNPTHLNHEATPRN
jgi:hypothetical protein